MVRVHPEMLPAKRISYMQKRRGRATEATRPPAHSALPATPLSSRQSRNYPRLRRTGDEASVSATAATTTTTTAVTAVVPAIPAIPVTVPVAAPHPVAPATVTGPVAHVMGPVMPGIPLRLGGVGGARGGTHRERTGGEGKGHNTRPNNLESHLNILSRANISEVPGSHSPVDEQPPDNAILGEMNRANVPGNP